MNKMNLFLNKLLIKQPKSYYNYNFFGEYINNKTKIYVQDEFGLCKIRPNNLLNGAKPGLTNAINKNSYLTNKFKKVHGDKYDYSLVNYINSTTDILIICRKHGIFKQRYTNHLIGSGCNKCAVKRTSLKIRVNLLEFIQRANKIHDNFYDYSLVNFNSLCDKIKINCPIHKIFEQRASSHLEGVGCNKCSNENLSLKKWINIENIENKKCIFYVLHCTDNNESFYKIGITSRTIKERFWGKSKLNYEYTITQEIQGDYITVWNLELLIKRKLQDFQYEPLKFFEGSKSECFKL